MAKILLAEDDKLLVRAYKDGLEQDGFEVVLAADGKETVEKAKEESPDLILLDIVMPNKDGIEALETIKNEDKTRDIPVIIITDSARDSDIKKCIKLGVVDYLIKSEFSLAQVIEKIKEHLS